MIKNDYLLCPVECYGYGRIFSSDSLTSKSDYSQIIWTLGISGYLSIN